MTCANKVLPTYMATSGRRKEASANRHFRFKSETPFVTRKAPPPLAS